MKVLWQGFCAQNFSWAIVAQNICRELINLGHDVQMFSTNGNDYFPEDLKNNLIGFHKENDQENILGRKPEPIYDMQLSYTALKNFGIYLSHGNRNRFGIWNYETTVIPPAFIKHYKMTDKVLPSSSFSKKIFSDNGMPEGHQVVIPHGIHPDRFSQAGSFPLKTHKKYKILVNIAQPHLRKNIPNLLKAYGNAFTSSDDVCLVLKVSRKSPQIKTDSVPFNDIYRDFRHEYKKCGEIEIIDYFIPNIEALYNACDIVFSMSRAECFWMPGLEALAANKVVIAPRYGGQLDFLSDENSCLIDGKVVRADARMQYWEPSPYAIAFEPDVNKASQLLRDVVNNYQDYHNKFSPNMKTLVPELTWKKVTEKIIDLCK